LQDGSHFYLEELVRQADLDEQQRTMRQLYESVFLVNFLGAELPDEPGQWRERAAHWAGLQLKEVEHSLLHN
jgi:hypothetical protein